MTFDMRDNLSAAGVTDLEDMKVLFMRLVMRFESLESKVRRLESSEGDLKNEIDGLKSRLDTLEPMVKSLSEIAGPAPLHPDSAKEGIVASKNAMPEPALYLLQTGSCPPSEWPSVVMPGAAMSGAQVLADLASGRLSVHEIDALASARVWGSGNSRTRVLELLLAGELLRISYGSEVGQVGCPTKTEKVVLSALCKWAAPPVRTGTGDLLFAVRRLLEEETILEQEKKDKEVSRADPV